MEKEGPENNPFHGKSGSGTNRGNCIARPWYNSVTNANSAVSFLSSTRPRASAAKAGGTVAWNVLQNKAPFGTCGIDEAVPFC